MGRSKFDKTCVLCGAKYEYCGNCSRFEGMPRWLETVHSINCKQIIDAVMNYKGGAKTPAECKKDLEACDLSYRDKFSDGMNGFITAILAVEDEPVVAKEAIKEEPKKEEPEVKLNAQINEKHEESKVNEPVKTEKQNHSAPQKKNNPYNYKKKEL